MPRRKNPVDVLANLALLMSGPYSDLVKAEATKQYVELKAKLQPAPAPAVSQSKYSEEELAAAFAKIGIDQPKPEPVEPTPEKPTVEVADQKPRPEPVDKPKPKSKPQVWRNQFGESEEQIKARLLREKQRASAEWAFQMGCPVNPEWPGV
jgi:outer membrane biosynthesis protein TonB